MSSPESQPFDKSSKWLIQHHGGSMLRLAGIGNVAAWRPAQAEVVQPRQLPDGLLEARLEGEAQDDLFLLEVATCPERRAVDQLTRDLMLVYLDRGELPTAITIVLRPKGRYRIPAGRTLRDRRGLSSCRLKWHVVELWTVPAEALLEAGDVGLIPWVPLTDYTDPPETIIRKCRERIDEHAPPQEKANFLAVTQVLTELRYRKQGLLGGLLSILGGEEAMLESPLIQGIVDKQVQQAVVETNRARAHRDILAVLETRFREIPGGLAEQVRSVADENRLTELLRKAVASPDLEAFRKELQK